MIKILNGDIFNSRCMAIVNPVNCVGVMGAGLAKEFKLRYPTNFEKYAYACSGGLFVIGKCLRALQNLLSSYTCLRLRTRWVRV